MADKSTIDEKAIVIMDRSYESYNVMAHIQEKGWFYLICVKDFGKHKTGIIDGLELPNTEEFDERINLNLARKQTNEMKKLFKMKNKYRRIAHNKTFDYLTSFIIPWIMTVLKGTDLLIACVIHKITICIIQLYIPKKFFQRVHIP